MRGTVGKCDVALERLKDVPDLTAHMERLQQTISGIPFVFIYYYIFVCLL